MGTLILVRHSSTAASADGRNMGQRHDPPLSDEGMERADHLGVALVAELAELPHDEIRIVSSPLLRCRQTAAAVASAVDFPPERIELERGLVEIDYGAWDGLTGADAAARDPELRARWEADPYRTACPDGESGQDVARRALAVLGPIESWLADDRARCAIVVAHNHVNRVRLCAFLGWPMADYRRRVVQDPAGYSLIGLGGGEPVIRRVNAAAR
jgi:broad specificity phosphatase PhoE